MFQAGSDGGHRPSGDDGQYQGLGQDTASQLGQDGGEHLGFDGENHDVRRLGGLAVVGGGFYPITVAQLLAAFLAGAAADDLFRGDQLLVEDDLDHRFGHGPAAYESQFCVVQHFFLLNSLFTSS